MVTRAIGVQDIVASPTGLVKMLSGQFRRAV